MTDKSLAELEAMVGDSRRVVEDLRIERGKVEEFARAVHDDNPVHYDETAAAERGFDAVPAPLTFTRTGHFPRYWPDGHDEFLPFELGFDPEHTIHGEQEYEYHRPATVGDVLSGDATLEDVYQRDGQRGGTMTFAVFELEYRDRDDEPVLTERATVIETDGAIEADDDD
jgi:acyl dehydratase